MSMTYAEIEQARRQAEAQIEMANKAVRQAVSLSAGRLKQAGCWQGDLAKLKKELEKFNAKTGEWKE